MEYTAEDVVTGGSSDDIPRRFASALDIKRQEFTELVQESEKNPVYADIVRNATEPEDIPNDCWGGLFFVIVEDFPDLRAGRAVMEGKVRTCYVFLLFLINLFIQGVLLFFIGKLLMMPGMLDTQNLYNTFRQTAFLNGVVEQSRFDDMGSGEKQNLCGMALSQGLFVRVILFLWVTTNVGELREVWRMTSRTVKLPDLPAGIDTRLMVRDLREREGGGEFCVICLNMKGKVGLFLLVFIPKSIIAIILTGTGCVWLVASESIGDLILNSLALAFVVKVDELIALVFYPQRLQKDVATLSLMLPNDPDEKDEDKRMRNSTYEILQCALVLFATMIFVEFIIGFQPVLPNYANDVTAPCLSFLNTQVPWCYPWQKNCFPAS